jgi:hypothetical protein
MITVTMAIDFVLILVHGGLVTPILCKILNLLYWKYRDSLSHIKSLTSDHMMRTPMALEETVAVSLSLLPPVARHGGGMGTPFLKGSHEDPGRRVVSVFALVPSQLFPAVAEDPSSRAQEAGAPRTRSGD